MTYAQLSDIKDLGSGQFSIAVAATVTTADGNERRIAVKILKGFDTQDNLTDEQKAKWKALLSKTCYAQKSVSSWQT